MRGACMLEEPMNPLEISESERKLLESVVKRRKSEELESGASAILEGQQPAPNDVSHIAASLATGKLKGRELQGGLIVARWLPDNSPQADEVVLSIVNGFGNAQGEMSKTGCLMPIFQIIAVMMSPSSPTFSYDHTAGYQPLFAIYVRTLQALKSPRGAAIAATLAVTESSKTPKDTGAIASAALPDLLAAASTAALPAEDRKAIAKLLEGSRIQPEIRELAAKTLSSLPEPIQG